MDIRISGRHVDVGDAFRGHVENRLDAIANKYLHNTVSATVTVAKEHHSFQIDCQFHTSQGIILKSRGEAGDAYGGFDAAAERIEKQLRRYKRRLKNHHGRGDKAARVISDAQSYIIAPEDEDEDAAPAPQPMIIAEMTTDIPEVSVGDAVMLMDLADSPAMMFRNSGNNELNMVYRRPDGNIGWIDPAPRKA